MAVTVIGNDPVWVGVPDSTPPENVMPDGSAPDSANVTVPTPFVWLNEVDGYAAPWAPPGMNVGPTSIAVGSVRVTKLGVDVQLVESFTTTEYVPAARLENTFDAWNDDPPMSE